MYIFVEPSLHCFGDWHTTYWLYNDWVTCCYIITCLCFKRHVLPWRAFLHVVHLDMLLRGCCIAAFSGTAGLSSAASAAMAAQPQGVISGLLHICYGTHTHTPLLTWHGSVSDSRPVSLFVRSAWLILGEKNRKKCSVQDTNMRNRAFPLVLLRHAVSTSCTFLEAYKSPGREASQ